MNFEQERLQLLKYQRKSLIYCNEPSINEFVSSLNAVQDFHHSASYWQSLSIIEADFWKELTRPLQ
jgi:hypothetical protein